ncbi:hypothetical protein [Burkholderia pseudomallei]|uniref:hypothetical protein n=1 Tax=Burkholderia pseudomallei TaxID=28450 RepID=UPI0002FB1E1B|nr:hypothetical protein [Burkholderia pseudomallei]AGZ30673.1 hypothetical protein BBK_4174 [Burkholderia pseudomallei NCTC 13179]MBM5584890.1 hypothetical protein [Burkholderia pseudomallei]ONC79936.1 hypothetical protein AQ922_29755 [Burkholderia pseudomallei]RPA02351.1 hypothetical protein EGT86_32020 [Burkholderia pseudomallei]
MSENTMRNDELRQLMLEEAERKNAEARRALADLIEGQEQEFQYFLDGYIVVGQLAMTFAREGLASLGNGQPARLMPPEDEAIFTARFRAFLREVKSAVHSGALVVREAPTMTPVPATRLSRWIEMDEMQLSLDDIIDVPLYIAFEDARSWLVQHGVPVPEMLNERASRLHARMREMLPNGPLSSLMSDDHQRAAVSTTQPDAKTTRRDDDPPPVKVRWREAIVVNWPSIIRECGSNPDARTVMRYLKAHDVTGYILPQSRTDELDWRTQDGDRKTVSLKTFKNALSLLRKHGSLKS